MEEDEEKGDEAASISHMSKSELEGLSQAAEDIFSDYNLAIEENEKTSFVSDRVIGKITWFTKAVKANTTDGDIKKLVEQLEVCNQHHSLYL